MLTKEKICGYIYAIVSALDECGTDAAESTFYLALGMDMDLWSKIRGLMLASDLIAVRSHRVSLTPKGWTLAMDCKAIKAGA